MDYDKIKKKILDKMTPFEKYRPSDLGYFAFGGIKFIMTDKEGNKHKVPYTLQGLALAIGKHLNKMNDEKLIIRAYRAKNNFSWYRKK